LKILIFILNLLAVLLYSLVFGARGLRQGSGILNADGTHGAAHLSSHTKQLWQDSRSSSAGISKDQYQNNRSVMCAILFYHSF